MNPIKTLLVPAQGAPKVHVIEPTLENLQALVGGYLEPIRFDGHRAYVDEEGTFKQLPPNVTASMILNRAIVGPALFLGDEGGSEETAVGYRTLQAVAVAALMDADTDTISAAIDLLRSHGYRVTPPDSNATPHVRRAAPDTSHLVAPKLGSQMDRVLSAIRSLQPLTDDALEEHLGLTHQSVSAARNALVRRGLVVDSTRRWPTRSGNKAILWVTPDRYEEFSR